MSDLIEKLYVGDIIRQELPNFASRAAGTVKQGASALTKGTMLGLILVGLATSAAKGGGNTGTGAVSALAAQPNAKVGVYKAIVEIAGTNAATWNLYDPNGKLIDQKQYSGSGATAVFANDQIHATITDGGTDFVVGDEFDITVAAGSGKYIPCVVGALDGSAVGAAILLDDIDPTGGDVTDVHLLTKIAQVDETRIIYDASVNSDPLLAAVQAPLVLAGVQFLAAQ
jgi:hypothetical protein